MAAISIHTLLQLAEERCRKLTIHQLKVHFSNMLCIHVVLKTAWHKPKIFDILMANRMRSPLRNNCCKIAGPYDDTAQHFPKPRHFKNLRLHKKIDYKLHESRMFLTRYNKVNMQEFIIHDNSYPENNWLIQLHSSPHLYKKRGRSSRSNSWKIN